MVTSGCDWCATNAPSNAARAKRARWSALTLSGSRASSRTRFHDPVDLALAGAHRLCGHHDEDPQEVRIAVEQRGGGLDQHSKIFLPGPDAPTESGHFRQVPLGAPAP